MAGPKARIGTRIQVERGCDPTLHGDAGHACLAAYLSSDDFTFSETDVKGILDRSFVVWSFRRRHTSVTIAPSDEFTASSRQPYRFPKRKWAFHTCEPSSWRPWPRDGVHVRPPQQNFQAFF